MFKNCQKIKVINFEYGMEKFGSGLGSGSVSLNNGSGFGYGYKEFVCI
jgi:hypothetical protein